jgi:hypothetical protein
VLVAVLAALALGAAASPAAAKTSCARQIIEDWVDDNRVDGTYELPCYREAIAVVPEDLKAYTGIVEDIQSARQRASRLVRRPTSADPNRPRSTGAENDPDRALFARGFDKLGARNVDAVPLPLLILASLALLLIGAGAAGLVARRMRSGRAHRPPAT